MFRLDISFLPFLILVPAILQVIICISTKKKRFLIVFLPLVSLVLAGYGFVADREGLYYPDLFAPDFMLSSASGGFWAFGCVFIGTILGTMLWAVVINAIKIFRRKK